MAPKKEPKPAKPPKKASTAYSPKLMGIYEQYDMARTAKNKMDAKAEAKKLKATKYAPAPMTAKQKETTRRAAEKKQALRNLKKDPILKGAKAVLKTAGNPVGAGIKAAGAAANRAKTVAREARDVVTAVGTTAKAFTKTGSNPNQRYSAKKQSIRNLATQVREVGSAAAKGKSGTSSGKVVMGKETNRPTGVSKGKKRK
jgi:hypothetical protein